MQFTGILYCEAEGSDTNRKAEGNTTREAEMGVTWPQAKGCWQPPEAKRGRNQILPQNLWREHSPAHILISVQETDFGLLASITVDKYMSIVVSHHVCGKKLTHY